MSLPEADIKGAPPVPKQVDAAAQRGEIRDAAKRVFAQRGVSGTGLAHVAREAGMGRSSLYHYYPNKEALLGDLMAETLGAEVALFRTCLRREGTTRERLLTVVDACVASLDEWADVGRMLLDFRLRDAAALGVALREIRGELAQTLRAGQERGEVDPELDPLHAAATLMGAIDGLLLQHFVDSAALDPERLRSELRRVAMGMLSP